MEKDIFQGKWPGQLVEQFIQGFSLVFIWVITAVFIACLIGTTQTAESAPRILKRLFKHADIYMTDGDQSTRLRIDSDHWRPQLLERLSNGGIPSFRQDKWWSNPDKGSCRAKATRATPVICSVSILIVASGTCFAWTLSALVPPEGFGCRQIGQACGLAIWIPSFIFQYLVARFLSGRGHHKYAYRITLLKDTIASIAFLQVILIPQIGILNRSGMFIQPMSHVLI